MPSTPEQPYLELLPAVDIKGGQAVQLVQGVDGSEKRFGDPIEAALRWQEAGAEWIHLVDLDAAFGHGHNRELQAKIVGTLDIQVEMSGGIRDDESLEAAMAAGCRRVNIGTAALEQPEWCAKAIATYGDRVAVGLDVRGTTLAARGWTREGGDLYETLARLDGEGCARYVVTDVNKDGMLQGPNLQLLRDVCAATDRPVVASGGVTTLDDIRALMGLVDEGVEGAIATYGDRVAVGLDVRGTTLAARGWTREGGDLYETLSRLDSEGCARYVVTDVNKDGMLQGPNLQLLRDVCAATSKPVVASGGVTTLDDIRALMGLVDEGVEGAIAGTALYEGRFTLEDALALTRPAS